MLLRDYQTECVRLVLDAFASQRNGDEYLVLACGLGKTVIFSHIAHTLARDHGLNILILAHRDELLNQAADKYRQVDPTAIIGKIGGKVHEYGATVTVASIATVSRANHLKHLQAVGYGLIIVDEAHHIMSAGYQRVIKALPDAFVLGVTATPDRLDKKEIFDGKQPLYSMSIIDGIKRGYLCDMRVIAIRTEINLGEIHNRGGDFNEEELGLAINTPARNQRVANAYLEHAPGRHTICFGVDVDHAQALAYTFNESGVTAAVITGDTDSDERKALYAQLRTGEIKVLTSVMVLSEGFDESSVDCVIMARPTQSRSLFVQCIGRGTRLHPGKKECILLDITDNCLVHQVAAPMTLHKAIGKHIKSNESLAEAIERDEKEEVEAKERKLTAKRLSDLYINMFVSLEWKENKDTGVFVMEVGETKHKIALYPCKGDPDLYEVWARLYSDRPGCRSQKWAGAQPIEAAQMFAERKAKLLHDDPKSAGLMDTRKSWRSEPISEPQKKKMKYHHLEWNEGMTKGQARDLIDAHLARVARDKAAKAARRAEKTKQYEAYA